MTAEGVLAAVTTAAFDAAVALGVDAATLTQSTSYDPREFAAPRATVPIAVHQRVLVAAAKSARSSAFPLRVASRFTPEKLDALGFCFLVCPDVRSIVDSFVRYYQLITTSSRLVIAELPRGARAVRFVPSGPLPLAGRLGTEVGIASTIHMIRMATSDRWSPVEVSFRHPAPSPARHHEEFFRCRIRWNAPAAGIVIAAASLDLPTVRGDRDLNRFLGRQVEARMAEHAAAATSWRGRVTDCARELLTSGLPSGASLAKRLATTERTLRRRLEDEDTSVRACVAELQRALAMEYLTAGRTVEEVAYLTGFNDASAFRRAFRRWTGSTPGQVIRSC